MGWGLGTSMLLWGRSNLSLLYDVRRRAQDTLVFRHHLRPPALPCAGEKAAMRTQVLEWMRFMEPAAVAIR